MKDVRDYPNFQQSPLKYTNNVLINNTYQSFKKIKVLQQPRQNDSYIVDKVLKVCPSDTKLKQINASRLYLQSDIFKFKHVISKECIS